MKYNVTVEISGQTYFTVDADSKAQAHQEAIKQAQNMSVELALDGTGVDCIDVEECG